VCSGLFSIVDNLGKLCKYNWGGIVYEYVVRILCQARFIHLEWDNFFICIYCWLYIPAAGNFYSKFKSEVFIILITIMLLMLCYELCQRYGCANICYSKKNGGNGRMSK